MDATLAIVGVAAVVTFPVTLIVGAALKGPLGRVESRLGIEIVGRWGPAEWILYATWFAFTAALASLWMYLRAMRGRPTSTHHASASTPPGE